MGAGAGVGVDFKMWWLLIQFRCLILLYLVLLRYCLLVFSLIFFAFMFGPEVVGWKIPFELVCNVNPAWLNRKLKVTA